MYELFLSIIINIEINFWYKNVMLRNKVDKLNIVGDQVFFLIIKYIGIIISVEEWKSELISMIRKYCF